MIFNNCCGFTLYFNLAPYLLTLILIVTDCYHSWSLWNTVNRYDGFQNKFSSKVICSEDLRSIYFNYVIRLEIGLKIRHDWSVRDCRYNCHCYTHTHASWWFLCDWSTTPLTSYSNYVTFLFSEFSIFHFQYFFCFLWSIWKWIPFKDQTQASSPTLFSLSTDLRHETTFAIKLLYRFHFLRKAFRLKTILFENDLIWTGPNITMMHVNGTFL